MTKMVDISGKRSSHREAAAEGRLRLRPESIGAIRERSVRKGDVFTVSQIAGIEAAKRTWQSVPLCHQIPLSSVDVEMDIDGDCVVARTTVVADYSTGVEMEAVVGTMAALINAWDMVKYLEKDDDGQYPVAEIFGVKVLKKTKEDR